MKEQIFDVNGVKVCSTVNSNLNSFCLSLYSKRNFSSENMTVAIKGNKKKINVKHLEDILKTLDN